MKCILSDKEIQRSTSPEADELLVQYHLFQTAIFIGTDAQPGVFGDAGAAASGDFSRALFVVPGVDFAIAWAQVFSWLESAELRWEYEHPDDATRLILEKVAGGSVRVSLSWQARQFVEVDVEELREVSVEAVDELVIKLVKHLPECPAEDVEESLKELEEAFEEL